MVLPRTMESSTSTTRLPCRLAVSGLNFKRTPDLAQAVVRLDEGAADVAVLDQPLVVGDAGRLAKPMAAGVAESGTPIDDVGVDRRFVRQLLAQPWRTRCTVWPSRIESGRAK